MKIYFLVLISVLLFGNAGRSQSHYGIKAGLNFANQDQETFIPQFPGVKRETNQQLGYQLGFFYKTNPHKHFLIAAEANFSVIGFSMDLWYPDLSTGVLHEKIGYVDIPLTLQYLVLNKLHLGLGP